MFLLNLTLGQFLLVAGSLTAITTLLYLIDRTRRRMQVATLRFWSDAEKPVVSQRRNRIQQPVSLLLQLLGLLLLLLALAQPRLGSRDALPGRHVLLLDTSSWMNARSAASRDRTLMDDARDRAVAYVHALPARDEVMLVGADALATPLTAFVSSHEQMERAIASARPAATSLHVQAALAFAQKVQQLGGRRGEITYIGPARITGAGEAIALPLNLRVIAVPDRANNVGLERVFVKRSAASAELWDIFVTVRNYGSAPRIASLLLGFDGAPVGGRRLTLAPASEQQVAFSHRSRSKGVLDARLLEPDDFADDNRAVLEVPGATAASVAVYSDSPEGLRPLLGRSSPFNAAFHPTSEYKPGGADLVVLDRFTPPVQPDSNVIYLDPPATHSPVSVRGPIGTASTVHWSAHPLAAGLRSRGLRLDSGTVFVASKNDEVVASVDAGPVILARNAPHRSVVVGFQPAISKLRYELATPLLFANLLRWALPGSFHPSSVSAQPVGTVFVDLERNVPPEEIQVTREDGTALPFSVRDRDLRFFTSTQGKVRVRVGNQESIYSLTLPEMWDTQWQAPTSVRTGVPRANESNVSGRSRDLWQVLAILGTLCFVAEWIMFGKINRAVRRAAAIPMAPFRKAS
jgi:hypothetical protein